jgi:hypothetical protein
MSPRVQLVLYPDGDSAFTAHSQVGPTLDVPSASLEEVVRSVVDHLREKYPLAAIRVTAATHDDFDATWHVYRDGLPNA